MKKSIVFVILAIGIIVILSNMSYEQQTLIPTLKDVLRDKPLEGFLSQFEFYYWGRTISVETRGYFYVVEFLIRKGTHFFGYGVLALIFFSFFKRLKRRFPMILSFVCAVIIASLDEYRQTMLPGRTGLVGDVVLDACGALTLLVVAKLTMYTYQYVKR